MGGLLHGTEASSRATIVETIPPGVSFPPESTRTSTVEALCKLIDSAVDSLDLTAMYWSLTTQSKNHVEVHTPGTSYDRSGDRVYRALVEAAERGVQIRIVQSQGFDPPTDTVPVSSESADLSSSVGDNHVEVRTVNMEDWYGAGIMHQKLWIADKRSMYIGSANTDWRSFTHVKELGILIENEPQLCEDATRYFEGWWSLAKIPRPAQLTREAIDPLTRIRKLVPGWSTLVPAQDRTQTPWPRTFEEPVGSWTNPRSIVLSGEGGEALISGGPPELCTSSQTFDLDAILNTIHDAHQSVCISVMDFDTVSSYSPGPRKDPQRVWWPTLTDALLEAAVNRQVRIRLLVSLWAHTSLESTQRIRAVKAVADSALDRDGGQFEVRSFVIPGWDRTADSKIVPHEYPDHTRVNHTKYIVTDRRVNIGTSNMTWSYFFNCAGLSFNASHVSLVNTLQSIFDRDWYSPFAHSI
jgi:phospholipase D3/4